MHPLLDQLAALEAAATKGPWHWRTGIVCKHPCIHDPALPDEDGEFIVAAVNALPKLREALSVAMDALDNASYHVTLARINRILDAGVQ